MIVVDSAFSSYKKVAKEALEKGTITSLFSFFANSVDHPKYDPINYVQKIHIPILFIHGKKDTIVDYHHSKDLYNKANKPKYLWLSEDTNHIGLFNDKKSRAKLINYLILFCE